MATECPDIERSDPHTQSATTPARRLFTILERVTAAFAGALTVDQVATVAVDEGAAALGASAAALALLDGPRGGLRVVSSRNVPDSLPRNWDALPLDAPFPIIDAVRTGKPIFFASRRELNARYPALRENDLGSREAFAILPLRSAGQVCGCVSFGFAGTHAFDDTERAFFGSLASLCAAALERARSYEAERAPRPAAESATQQALATLGVPDVDPRHAAQQAAIAKFSSWALRNTDCGSLFDIAVAVIAEALEIESAAVFELGADGGLRVAATYGWRDAGARAMDGVLAEARYALQLGGPLFVRKHGTASEGLPSLMPQYGPRHGVAVVIPGADRPLGVICLHTEQDRHFGPPAAHFLEGIANIISAAVQRRQVEDEHAALLLQIAEAKYETLLETAPDGVLVLDGDGRIVVANAQVERLFGYSRDELARLAVEDLVPVDRRAEHLQHRLAFMRDATRRPMGTGLAVHGRRKDGTVFPAEVSLSATVIGQGLLVTALIRDVTDRVRAEADLRRALDGERLARQQAEAERAKFQAVFEHVPAAIMYVDAATGQTIRNDYSKAMGWYRETLAWPPGPARHVLTPDGQPVATDDLVAVRALRGELVASQELLIVGPDGSRQSVLAAGCPVLGPAGAVTGAIVIIQDIAQIKAVERFRDEWTSVIAHDLRQPVSVIKGFAGLLELQLKRPGDTEVTPVDRSISHIRAAASRLSAMISDLLDFSLLDTKRLRMERRLVDPAELLIGVAARLREALPNRGIELDLAEPLPQASLDPSRIEQVLGNLALNADKYGADDSAIHISASRCPGGIQISVANRGPAIPPEDVPELFSRFRRRKHSEESQVEGLGLGLYICKGIVEAHGGRIWVERTPDELTRFSFTIVSEDGAAYSDDRQG